jgi:hypothetical protein
MAYTDEWLQDTVHDITERQYFITFEVKIATYKLKRYKSPGTGQIPTEFTLARRNTLRPEIHKLINSICNKEALAQQWKESITVSIIEEPTLPNCIKK